jgi:hypothetical protein
VSDVDQLLGVAADSNDKRLPDVHSFVRFGQATGCTISRGSGITLSFPRKEGTLRRAQPGHKTRVDGTHFRYPGKQRAGTTCELKRFLSGFPRQFRQHNPPPRPNDRTASPESFITMIRPPRDGTPQGPYTFRDYSSRTYEGAMSYGGKQRPRLFVAIGAFFMIFGSTASDALPPQAIPEEVKSCKAISNDQQRLKCFDDLFADKANQPNSAGQVSE